LQLCPHSIDVGRFAEPKAVYEQEAARWRSHLGIPPDCCVILFAGKFEPKKRPLELMRTVAAMDDRRVILVLVGAGELEPQVRAFATGRPDLFHVLPFQNQSRMPVVYRLGDLFVLPSAFGETWGIAVNEALACGRPVLVSDRVGCAADVVDESCGQVFSWDDPSGILSALRAMTNNRNSLLTMRPVAANRAWMFDVARTEATLMACLARVCTE
jgi:glycosyltransferase involved in cell wall biosynthesis